MQQASLKVIALFADGLRGDFSNTLRPVLQMIISKCKEKRLLNDVKDVLKKAVRFCVPFEALSEEISELVKTKKTPPHARICLMECTTDLLLSSADKISNDSLKLIADMLTASCEDSDPKVRDMCVRSFVTLADVVKARGRSAIDAHKRIVKLELSVPKVYKKIQAMKDGGEATSTSSVRPGISKVSSTSAVAAKKAAPNSMVKSKSVSVGKSSTAGFSSKMKAASTSMPSISENDDNIEEVIMSPEEAVEKLGEMNIAGWSNIQTLMASAKWQDRVEALEGLDKYIEANEGGATICVPLTSFLKSSFPKLKSTNMTVVKTLMQLYTTCATHTGTSSFSKSVALEIIQAWGDKFSDKKGKDAFATLLTVLATAVSPSFCFKQMKKVMDKTKAPLGHQYFLEWVKATAVEFGASSLPVQQVIAFCHVELENKVAGVRTAGVEVVGALYNQLGPKFLSIAITDSLKPAMKTILEAEFEKVGYDAAKKPTRTVRGEASDQKAEGFSIPRTDLSVVLDRSTISDLTTTDGKNSWNVRKTAMEAVIEACERSGHFVEGNAAAKEVLKGLKSRLNDTQANLKPMGANSLGHVLSSLDSESCHKFLKPLATALLSGVADNKKSMRDAVVAAMQRIVTLNKDDALAETNLIGTLLSSSVEAIVNPVGREELLTFFMVHVQSDAVIKTDCSDLAPSLVVALQDKVASTRILTEHLMTALVGKGYMPSSAVEKSFRSLPPAAQRSLQAPKDRILAAEDSSALSGGTDNKKQAPPAEIVEESVPKKMGRQPSKSLMKNAPSSNKVNDSVSASIPAPVESSSSSANNPYFPLKKTNKAKRLDEYYKSNWPQPPEEPTDHERASLRAAWEPLVDKVLFDILFPEKTSGLSNQDSVMDAVSELLSILNDEPAGATSGCIIGPKCSEMVIQHTDLMIKWVALALSLRESSNGLLKLLLLVATIFNKIKNVPNLQLHEGEIVCILPALVDKSGHKSERHKFGFKHAINACTPIVSSNRLCQLLLSGLTCKNKKTRVVCIEEIDRIVEVSGPSSLGKVGIREISSTLNNKDTDVGVRNAALDFCFTLYMTIGYDRKKLTKLLGDISERAIPMIDHRIKEKMKTQDVVDASSVDKSSKASSSTESKTTSTGALVPKNNAPEPAPISSAPKVTTPVMKTNNFDLEDDVAFRLDMTPPEAESSTTTSSRFTSADVLPLDIGVETVSASLSSSQRVDETLVELDGVYVDIISKLDAMLGSGDKGVEDKVQCAKDHLKMLHSIISSPDVSGPGKPFDLLQRHAPTLVDRLIRCIDYGFQREVTPQTDNSKDLINVVDVGLISVSLVCMFALLDCNDLLRNLDESKVKDMVCTGIKWLVDTRFFPSEGSSLAPKVEQDLAKALNAFLIKIGSSRPFKNGVVICAVIDVLSLCIKERELETSLSPSCAKPLSRLLLKVLSNEASRGSTKAFHLPNVDTMRLMSVLHSFFNSHPSTVPSNDIPYCCAKTVFAQLIDALGSSEIDRLCQVLKIPDTAFIYRLSKRLSSSAVSEVKTSTPAVVPVELDQSIVDLVTAVSSSRDKVAAIRHLRDNLKRIPGVNISTYLTHTSTTFRSFVLDTLAKMDSEANNTSIVDAGDISIGLVQSPAMKNEDGSEALRILEGLKSNSKRSFMASPLHENVDRPSSGSFSSRSVIQDKIKGTLNSISASIAADSTLAIGSAQKNVVSSGCGADSDLAARLARLKRMESLSSGTAS